MIFNRTGQVIPPKVMTAVDHVRTFFPEVAMVVFNDVGRWQYMGEDFEHVAFKYAPIDQSLLEAAADESYEVAGHPCVFQPYTTEPDCSAKPA